MLTELVTVMAFNCFWSRSPIFFLNKVPTKKINFNRKTCSTPILVVRHFSNHINALLSYTDVLLLFYKNVPVTYVKKGLEERNTDLQTKGWKVINNGLRS